MTSSSSMNADIRIRPWHLGQQRHRSAQIPQSDLPRTGNTGNLAVSEGRMHQEKCQARCGGVLDSSRSGYIFLCCLRVPQGLHL